MPTCGSMYKDALLAVADCAGDRLSIGFLIGQSEKVFIGACLACMTKDAEICEAAKRIANMYGLEFSLLSPHTANVRSPEIWLSRTSLRFNSHPVDSSEWNLLRAAICGVPATEINLNYHK